MYSSDGIILSVGEETSIGPAGHGNQYSHEEIGTSDEYRERPNVKPSQINRENDCGSILGVVMKPCTGHKHAAAEKEPAPKREAQDPKRALAQRREESGLAPMQHT